MAPSGGTSQQGMCSVAGQDAERANNSSGGFDPGVAAPAFAALTPVAQQCLTLGPPL